MWHQVKIDDDCLISRASFLAILDIVEKCLQPEWVALSRVEAWPQVFPAAPAAAFQFSEFRSLCKDLVQIVWGDFFFYESRPEEVVREWTEYEQSVRQSLATISVIDNTSYFIYTRSLEIVEHLRLLYPAAICKSGKMTQLDFPQ